ncbi:MAG: polyprenyl synthetase family protein [Actinomycetales bacterium]
MPSPLDVEDLRSRVQKVIDDHLSLQERRLDEVGPDLAVLVEGIRELLSGGKRLRPAFCYWGWRGLGGEDCAEIVNAATGLELFQAAALLHDDVMDGSAMRRGRPAMHQHVAGIHTALGWSGDSARFGAAAATLAGDLCLVWSDELLATSGLRPDQLAAGRAVFDTMRTQLMGGQYLDVLEQAAAEQQGGADVERALQVLRFKSAKYTVEHPLLLGASMAGASGEVLAGLSSYGLPLGEAFQLRDDVLGVFGDPEVTGKPAGDDLREGKRTVLVAQVRRLGTAAEQAVVSVHLGDPALTDAGVQEVRAAMVSSGALDSVEAMIDERAERARAALRRVPLQEPATEVLEALVGTATARQA